MTQRPIYLDHNATTPVLPEVVDAMLPFLTEHFGNPSSGHAYGRKARESIERARGEVAALVGCDADEIIFTSGATEASNLAIRGVKNGDRRRVVTSVIEHSATLGAVSSLAGLGYQVIRLGVDAAGQISTRELAAEVDESTALVTLLHSNGETGVLQPVREAAIAARRASALMHTDAAQSVGKVPIDVRMMGVDLMSIAGHKLYAPKGVGALYVRRGVKLDPLVLGAGHERGVRPGTENVASIVGFGAACVIALRDLARESARVQDLRDLLWMLLSDEIPDLALNGHATRRLPNTLSVRFPNVSATVLLARATGVAASTGSACHDGNERPSAVLLAMGIGAEEALGSVRLSLGRMTSHEDVERAAGELASCWRDLVRSIELLNE
jgi:cysteine desulfurase